MIKKLARAEGFGHATGTTSNGARGVSLKQLVIWIQPRSKIPRQLPWNLKRNNLAH